VSGEKSTPTWLYPVDDPCACEKPYPVYSGYTFMVCLYCVKRYMPGVSSPNTRSLIKPAVVEHVPGTVVSAPVLRVMPDGYSHGVAAPRHTPQRRAPVPAWRVLWDDVAHDTKNLTLAAAALILACFTVVCIIIASGGIT
jgi:hypothetical protein